MDGTVAQEAALRGEIAPLRYAVEHGCPYFPYLIIGAVYGMNLECIQYLVEEQGMFMSSTSVFLVALLRGKLDCLQYLLDQGCPYQGAEVDDDEDGFDYYFQKDNKDMVLCIELAVERGWEPGANFIRFVVLKDPLCREWLLQMKYFDP